MILILSLSNKGVNIGWTVSDDKLENIKVLYHKYNTHSSQY